ncbi:Crp/Fnr family transcriptional regulator [Moheibacter sediminis]|uniref:cAMP-binding domain of CRP or a regulatory subunit of cAMP-dependent protein kinases n=1 Tax=Moheibacter sediminis TaxID=1434700 RepID=A0A1W1YZ48_9FLAO|nr:Crp/Fnr family transcriptional regulator [Moheibacter sediminis]SMC41485.1 cAMP-binding domain of CRP or a regulatory subunit of cAMP-dependent protein kinases [Moheibacter sediminis]
MSGIFKAHLEKFIQVSEEDFPLILDYFHVLNVRKKENLLVEGNVCKFHYFVLEGCLRKFFINEKGTEQTTEFAIETWWITDHLAYEHKLVTDFYIQAVEKSVVLVISQEAQEELLIKFPEMERYFRFVYQRAFAAAQRRLRYLFNYSKEEFYHKMVEAQPAFVQRIPQYLIASFLGFTPEYLSEIRAKSLS